MTKEEFLWAWFKFASVAWKAVTHDSNAVREVYGFMKRATAKTEALLKRRAKA